MMLRVFLLSFLALVAAASAGVGAFMLHAIVFPVRAWPHEAPTGWSYPFSCCSGYDCRPVDGPAASPRTTPVQIGIDKESGDYIISTTGERLGQLGIDARVKMSPDGAFHWCSKKGADDTNTICLFVPPNLF